ncbi:Autophagy-related protein 8 [Hondaea fermentalgiana]|uniref:Autophagy-related protein 8 n=1 Tax=Hondaea fermentalgiana TaxID=2315210 RepID=A0A2R5GRB2_9STRA|nr:Autophagy-related protein 8 [Hondaea fermentalgiana]|eukprot:GBG31173.1 Autophagy-related protein 8 [Hondaea fermentalgiana]
MEEGRREREKRQQQLEQQGKPPMCDSARRIRGKNPGRIPIICRADTEKGLPGWRTKRIKFLVSDKLNVSQFRRFVRSNLINTLARPVPGDGKLKAPKLQLFLESGAELTDDTLSITDLDALHCDEDGFLYLTYITKLSSKMDVVVHPDDDSSPDGAKDSQLQSRPQNEAGEPASRQTPPEENLNQIKEPEQHQEPPMDEEKHVDKPVPQSADNESQDQSQEDNTPKVEDRNVKEQEGEEQDDNEPVKAPAQEDQVEGEGAEESEPASSGLEATVASLLQDIVSDAVQDSLEAPQTQELSTSPVTAESEEASDMADTARAEPSTSTGEAPEPQILPSATSNASVAGESDKATEMLASAQPVECPATALDADDLYKSPVFAPKKATDSAQTSSVPAFDLGAPSSQDSSTQNSAREHSPSPSPSPSPEQTSSPLYGAAGPSSNVPMNVAGLTDSMASAEAETERRLLSDDRNPNEDADNDDVDDDEELLKGGFTGFVSMILSDDSKATADGQSSSADARSQAPMLLSHMRQQQLLLQQQHQQRYQHGDPSLGFPSQHEMARQQDHLAGDLNMMYHEGGIATNHRTIDHAREEPHSMHGGMGLGSARPDDLAEEDSDDDDEWIDVDSSAPVDMSKPSLKDIGRAYLMRKIEELELQKVVNKETFTSSAASLRQLASNIVQNASLELENRNLLPGAGATGRGDLWDLPRQAQAAAAFASNAASDVSARAAAAAGLDAAVRSQDVGNLADGDEDGDWTCVNFDGGDESFGARFL